jgi:hypothetical protein
MMIDLSLLASDPSWLQNSGEGGALFETVANPNHRSADTSASTVRLATIHTGSIVPRRFWEAYEAWASNICSRQVLETAHLGENDWGADHVAYAVAQVINSPAFHRVRLARTVVDSARFPGVTPPYCVTAARRLAIAPPFSEIELDGGAHHQLRCALLAAYDDVVNAIQQSEDAVAASAGTDTPVAPAISLSVHTYDPRNPSLTERPDVGVVHVPYNFFTEHGLSPGSYDPLFPPELADSTADPHLAECIAGRLESHGYRVGRNYPYQLPEGSIEMRFQVRSYFHYLRRIVRQQFNEPEGSEAVWRMLIDVTHRDPSSAALRSALHAYLPPQPPVEDELAQSVSTYRRIEQWLRTNLGRSVLLGYARSRLRPSALLVELRRDLVWDISTRRHAETIRTRGKETNICRLSAAIGEGILDYLAGG